MTEGPEIRTRKGSILIVDDEETVGRALKRMLALEHDVTVETCAAKALARVQNGETFDVIFCDLMMPDMTGMELHAELCRSHPHLASRLAFLTGGAFTPRAIEYLASVDNRRFEKPFDIELLLGFAREQCGDFSLERHVEDKRSQRN